MKWIVVIALLFLEGCRGMVINDPVAVCELAIALMHADDTPAEHRAMVEERLKRLDRWCKEDKYDNLSCTNAKDMREELKEYEALIGYNPPANEHNIGLLPVLH